MARITLYGMLQYDPTLFDDVALPDGYVKTDLVNKIIATSGELFPYHQVPPQLKINITRWFATRYYDFQQMYNAFHAQYNPIENYDRKEDNSLTHQEKGGDTETTTLGTQENTQYGRKDTATYGRKEDMTHGLTTVQTPDTTTISENMVSAYDVNTYQPRSHDTVTNTGDTTTTNSGTDSSQSSGTDSSQLSGTDTVSRSGADTKQTNYGRGYDDMESKRVHGNIGVTTNQQMITSELDMRIQYDLYGVIAEMFEREFIVQVY